MTSTPTPLAMSQKILESAVSDAESALAQSRLTATDATGHVDNLRQAELRYRPQYLRAVAAGLSGDDNQAAVDLLERSRLAHGNLLAKAR